MGAIGCSYRGYYLESTQETRIVPRIKAKKDTILQTRAPFRSNKMPETSVAPMLNEVAMVNAKCN